MQWTQDVIDYLSQEGYDPVFGARPLKRLIQDEIVNLLAKELLEGRIVPGQNIKLELKNNKIGINHKSR